MYARTAFLSHNDTLNLVLLFINTFNIRIITDTAKVKRILHAWQSALVTLTETDGKAGGRKKKGMKSFFKDRVVELICHPEY